MERLLSSSEKLSWLRLIRSQSVGPISFFQFLDKFGSAEATLEALPHLAKRQGKTVRVVTMAQAEDEMAALQKLGARLLAWGEPDYPEPLSYIPDPPPLLSVLGDVDLLNTSCLGIVGARNASANGRSLTRKIAADMGAAGWVVASGMARGIDTEAHKGALTTGTIAVLAGGIDHVYPKENQSLYDAIKESGALISECAPGTVPKAGHFPRRNRIISGLSWGVLVVEATKRSGSLITARMALEQGREIFAVPGWPSDPRAGGPNTLLRSGAVLTESAEDILAEAPTHQTQRINNLKKQAQKIDNKEFYSNTTPSCPPQRPPSELEKYLSSTPVPVDELVRECQFSPAALSEALLEMELSGRLERHPGNRVSLKVEGY